MSEELKLALKSCVEATGEDLDGNNNDYDWLVRHGASIVKERVNEANIIEEHFEQLQAEHKIMKDALKFADNKLYTLEKAGKEISPRYMTDAKKAFRVTQNALKQLEGK